MTITIIGGTGPQGKGLAKRLALSGQNVIIGSRNKQRAEEISDELNQLLPNEFKNIFFVFSAVIRDIDSAIAIFSSFSDFGCLCLTEFFKTEKLFSIGFSSGVYGTV